MYVAAEQSVNRAQDRKECVRNEHADGAREDGLAGPRLVCCLPRLHVYADGPDNPSTRSRQDAWSRNRRYRRLDLREEG